MARSEARLSVDIWAPESDFTELTSDAQWMYFFLLSQRDIQHTGLIALRERRWSRAAKDMTEASISARLVELEAARYVFIDHDTEELLVRTYIRHDKVYLQPKTLRAAADRVHLIESPRLRLALAAELRRVSHLGMTAGSRTILNEMISALPDPEETPGGMGIRNPTPTPISDQQDIEVNPTPRPPGDRGVVTAVRRAAPNPYSPKPLVPPSAGAFAPQNPERPELIRDDQHLQPTTAQTLIADWIDRCPKAPPGNVVGQIGKHLKAMLAEGIDPDDLRRGLLAWHTKGLHPSTLPSVVNEVMNTSANGARASPNEDILTAAMRRAQAREEAT